MYKLNSFFSVLDLSLDDDEVEMKVVDGTIHRIPLEVHGDRHYFKHHPYPFTIASKVKLTDIVIACAEHNKEHIARLKAKKPSTVITVTIPNKVWEKLENLTLTLDYITQCNLHCVLAHLDWVLNKSLELEDLQDDIS